MNDIIYIYSLSCPVTGKVRYIGQTNNLHRRMSSHLWYAKNRRRHHKDKWINSLIIAGESPVVDVIEECCKMDANFWEEYYIFLYRSWGFDLVNHSLFPTKSGISYNKRPKHSKVMRAKFKNDVKFAKKMMGIFKETMSIPANRQKQIINSQKIIQQPECLKRRANTLRKTHQRLFYAYKNGVYLGSWVNKIQCSLDLKLNLHSITRCLCGIRSRLYDYTFEYAEGIGDLGKLVKKEVVFYGDGTMHTDKYYETVKHVK